MCESHDRVAGASPPPAPFPQCAHHQANGPYGRRCELHPSLEGVEDAAALLVCNRQHAAHRAHERGLGLRLFRRRLGVVVLGEGAEARGPRRAAGPPAQPLRAAWGRGWHRCMQRLALAALCLSSTTLRAAHPERVHQELVGAVGSAAGPIVPRGLRRRVRRPPGLMAQALPDLPGHLLTLRGVPLRDLVVFYTRDVRLDAYAIPEDLPRPRLPADGQALQVQEVHEHLAALLPVG
mmetsp:Transcript_15963/g.43903  ORF Transcript_15963/g.43903 Transcript_15963/m.43903 type:complete len:236 (+) Transcript_15963:93-800(+)